MNILHYPNNLLRRVAQPVTDAEFGTHALLAFAHELGKAMLDAKGIGLAATQVASAPAGHAWRMFAMAGDEPGTFSVVCNPEIIVAQALQTGDEGCLSFASVQVRIDAPMFVVLRYRETDGLVCERVAVEGLRARCVWHETQHLDGKLLVDRLGLMAKAMFLRDVRKSGRDHS